jgi:hypothetical protein
MYACNCETGHGFFEGCADKRIDDLLFAAHPTLAFATRVRFLVAAS